MIIRIIALFAIWQSVNALMKTDTKQIGDMMFLSTSTMRKKSVDQSGSSLYLPRPVS